jgi:hypothetical protein
VLRFRDEWTVFGSPPKLHVPGGDARQAIGPRLPPAHTSASPTAAAHLRRHEGALAVPAMRSPFALVHAPVGPGELALAVHEAFAPAPWDRRVSARGRQGTRAWGAR